MVSRVCRLSKSCGSEGIEISLRGRGQPWAVFPRCSLDPYQSRYGHFARAFKNSQLTCGGITIICETVH
jgi:hypothetical protein